MALYNSYRDAKIAWRKAGGTNAIKGNFTYLQNGKTYNFATKKEVAKSTPKPPPSTTPPPSSTPPPAAPPPEEDDDYAERYRRHQESIRKAAELNSARSRLTSVADKRFFDGLGTHAEKVAFGNLSSSGRTTFIREQGKTSRRNDVKEAQKKYDETGVFEERFRNAIDLKLTPDQLIDIAMREDKTTDLQSQSWWSGQKQGTRNNAWNKLQHITSSPEALAKYVKDKGITDLQNKKWWSESPHKTAAWNIVKPDTPEPSVEPPAGDKPAVKTFENGNVGYLGANGKYYNSIKGANTAGGGFVGKEGVDSPIADAPEEGVEDGAVIDDEVIDEEEDFTDFSKLPSDVLESEYWDALTNEQKVQVAMNYNMMALGNEQEQKAWKDALETAKEAAEPYFREQLRMEIDTISNYMEELTQDWDARASRLSKNIDEIAADIESGGEEMTVEEEANRRQQIQNYEGALGGLASRGLISSSFRAETDVAKEEIAESTRRQQARQRQSTSRAARDQFRAIETKYGSEGAERYIRGEAPLSGDSLGIDTSHLAKLEGYSPLGDIVGTERERRAQDIYTRAGALKGLNTMTNPLLNPFSSSLT